MRVGGVAGGAQGQCRLAQSAHRVGDAGRAGAGVGEQFVAVPQQMRQTAVVLHSQDDGDLLQNIVGSLGWSFNQDEYRHWHAIGYAANIKSGRQNVGTGSLEALLKTYSSLAHCK